MFGSRLAASALVAATVLAGSSSALLPGIDLSALTPGQKASADLVSDSFKGYFQPDASASSNATRRDVGFTNTGSTTNDGDCSDLELVYVRSGNEVPTSMGLLGVPLWDALKALKPDGLTAYNVNYDSTMSELFITSTVGGFDAANHINAMAGKCPDQRFAVVGYSKGTIVVHNITPSSNFRNRIIATAVIGDTMNRNFFVPPLVFKWQWPSAANRVKSLCNDNDSICWPGGTDINRHTYQAYINQMPDLAKWIIDQYNQNK